MKSLINGLQNVDILASKEMVTVSVTVVFCKYIVIVTDILRHFLMFLYDTSML